MIAIYLEDLNRTETAQQLASKLRLPITKDPHDYPILLVITSARLELRFPNSHFKPIYVDFLGANWLHRLKQIGRDNELIAKAVGIKKNFRPTIVDTTAGLGGDALVLTALGCQVTMIERSPIVAALLRDGLERAKQAAPEQFEQLELLEGDAKQILTTLHDIDVAYLDPMFPVRTKSALVKKEMRVLKEIVGEDQDSSELLEVTLSMAKKRVVVKRPLYAETLSDQKPDITYKGRATRFDVYLPVIQL